MSDFALTLLVIHFMVACCYGYVLGAVVVLKIINGEPREPREEPEQTRWRMSILATTACSALLWEVHVLAWLVGEIHAERWKRQQ